MGHRRDTNTRLTNIENVLNSIRPRTFDHADRIIRLEEKADDQRLEIADLWEEGEENYRVLLDRANRTDETLTRVAATLLRLAERLVALEKAQADTDLLTKLTASVVSTGRKRKQREPTIIQSGTCDCCGVPGCEFEPDFGHGPAADAIRAAYRAQEDGE